MKKNVLVFIFSLGLALSLTSCKKQKQETVIIEEKRISGPLSDETVAWTESDYK